MMNQETPQVAVTQMIVASLNTDQLEAIMKTKALLFMTHRHIDSFRGTNTKEETNEDD